MTETEIPLSTAMAVPNATTAMAVPNATTTAAAHIYITGIGGLGNSLYQIACAVHFAKLSGAEIVLHRGATCLLSGSAEWAGRKAGVYDKDGRLVTYDRTIFAKLRFVDKLPPPDDTSQFVFSNGYGGTLPHWDANGPLVVRGYQQHRDLFAHNLYDLGRFISVEDAAVLAHLTHKYAGGDVAQFAQCVCVGVRRGPDFAGMTKMSNAVYNKTVRERFPGMRPLLVCDVKTLPPELGGAEPLFPTTTTSLSDEESTAARSDVCDLDGSGGDRAVVVTESKLPWQTPILVDEPDIWQLHLARLCPNMIVSESTFHAWMGYFVTETFGPKAKVVCFNNTDITNRNLHLSEWTRIDL